MKGDNITLLKFHGLFIQMLPVKIQICWTTCILKRKTGV